jgi:uncharacterized protein with PIN domain
MIGMNANSNQISPETTRDTDPNGSGAFAGGALSFIADVNVGKLAKWLRILGYDVLFINPIDDALLVQIGMRDGRIVLTKDTHIAERRVATSGQVRVVEVKGVRVWDQIRFLADKLGLRYTLNLLSRCIECNVPLESVDRTEVKGLVPPYVYGAHEQYMVCPHCGKIYWPGTHWQRMRDVAEEVLGEGRVGDAETRKPGDAERGTKQDGF